MKRISLICLLFLRIFICPPLIAQNKTAFIRVEGTQFIRDGKPYYYLGTNFWYGCNLGALAEGGDRGRLIEELDLLKSLGIDNLRIMGGSEGLTQHNTVHPPIQPELGQYNEDILDGLDFLLAEMKKRDMVAVIFLTNYWVWSGGMAQYMAWIDNVPFPNPFTEEYSWSDFMIYSARFYTHEAGNEAFRKYIKKIINRKNRHTGLLYKDDPTIMAWQLANEPRPSLGEDKVTFHHVFTKWIGETADYIRSLDPNHLISTGNEGAIGCNGVAETYLDLHQFKNIDYMTVHLWILNWSWYDPLRPQETYPEAEKKAAVYLDDHIGFARDIGKPLVLEEFGIPRDFHSYSMKASTSYRDKYFQLVFEHIFEDADSGGPFAGSNFWTWGGFGKPRNPDEPFWRNGDDYTGDPPQEPQGRNSVFAADANTVSILRKYAKKMNAISK